MRVMFIDLDNKKSDVKFIREPFVKGIIDYGVSLHVNNKTNELNLEDKNNYFIIGNGYKDKAVFIFRNVLNNRLEISLVSGLGIYLKKADLDGIIIYGKSDRYFLIIENDNVVFLEDNLPENINEKYENLSKELKNIYSVEDFSISLLGLGSRVTKYGNIVTFYNKKSFSNEGVGSSLYQQHYVTGFSIGGRNEYKEMDIEIEESKSLYNLYSIYRGNLPYLNYQNIYLNREEREKFYLNFVDNIAQDANLPFEVFHTGPFLGIFDLELIKKFIEKVNSYGIDIKYLTYVLGAIMEGIERNKISYDKKPVFDINKYKEDYSYQNFEVANDILDKIAYNELSIFGNNIREIVNKFDIKDISFYIPLGEKYDTVPFYLISLGLIFPNLYYDKHFTDFEIQYLKAEEYAKLCKSKLIFTYNLHNLRREEYEESKWIKDLIEYNKNSLPRFYESKRAVDYVKFIFNELNIKENIEEYWNKWYNSYFS